MFSKIKLQVYFQCEIKLKIILCSAVIVPNRNFFIKGNTYEIGANSSTDTDMLHSVPGSMAKSGPFEEVHHNRSY